MASLNYSKSSSFFFIIFFLLLTLCVTQENLSTHAVDEPYLSIKFASTLEKVDLGINENVNETESVFQRKFVLLRPWDNLILNLSVQNFGDSLDNVLLEVTTDGVQVQSIFKTLEQVGFTKSIAYQFEIPQLLIVNLNHTGQKEHQLEIRLLLDHTVTWRSPKVDFSINTAEIIGLNSSQLIDNEELILFAPHHQYQIQPADFSMLEKKLLVQSYFFASFPPDKQLDCKITVVSHDVELNYISVDGEVFHISKSREFSFNRTFDYLPATDFFSLKILISPNYNRLSGITQIRISLNISGFLAPNTNFSFNEFLDSHPIPGWIMFPLLLITLFGIPYALAYQEHVANQDENIFDSKKQTQL
ncbi:MAG: hypothetical protein ACFE95_02305 [Candidatus Hodarchaeota archaeon]